MDSCFKGTSHWNYLPLDITRNDGLLMSIVISHSFSRYQVELRTSSGAREQVAPRRRHLGVKHLKHLDCMMCPFFETEKGQRRNCNNGMN